MKPEINKLIISNKMGEKYSLNLFDKDFWLEKEKIGMIVKQEHLYSILDNYYCGQGKKENKFNPNTLFRKTLKRYYEQAIHHIILWRKTNEAYRKILIDDTCEQFNQICKICKEVKNDSKNNGRI